MSSCARSSLHDPDLPAELLPAGWHGREAHDFFLAAHGQLRDAAEECVDALVNATEWGGGLSQGRDMCHAVDGRQYSVVVWRCSATAA